MMMMLMITIVYVYLMLAVLLDIKASSHLNGSIKLWGRSNYSPYLTDEEMEILIHTQLLSDRCGMKSVFFQILSLKIECYATSTSFLHQAEDLIHG